ncbi:MAG: conserved rane protein of unknown function [Myxococcaceae bacterium]|nr:conserved rane protein of unknown function [Myxococcaceae bacterium]
MWNGSRAEAEVGWALRRGARSREHSTPWPLGVLEVPELRRLPNVPLSKERLATADAAASCEREDLVITTLLSAIAGSVDAVGLLCLGGLLSWHVTASLMSHGASVSARDPSSVGARLLMLTVFVLAVAVSHAAARAVAACKLPLLPSLLSLLTAALVLNCVAAVVLQANVHEPDTSLLVLRGLGVTCMGLQNTLMRLALPKASSTTVMTGNFAQLVLTGLDLLWQRVAGTRPDDTELRAKIASVVAPLLGYLVGSSAAGYFTSRHGLLSLSLPAVCAVLATFRSLRRARSLPASRTRACSRASRPSSPCTSSAALPGLEPRREAEPAACVAMARGAKVPTVVGTWREPPTSAERNAGFYPKSPQRSRGSRPGPASRRSARRSPQTTSRRHMVSSLYCILKYPGGVSSVYPLPRTGCPLIVPVTVVAPSQYLPSGELGTTSS